MPDDWVDEAACQSTNADFFFLDRGQSSYRAKRICHDCVVLPECLDYAIETNQKFGIWGGKSERERRTVRKEMMAGKTILEIVGMSLTT